jgi:hypothetical protein
VIDSTLDSLTEKAPYLTVHQLPYHRPGHIGRLFQGESLFNVYPGLKHLG